MRVVLADILTPGQQGDGSLIHVKVPSMIRELRPNTLAPGQQDDGSFIHVKVPR
jgi:hypothetical protein